MFLAASCGSSHHTNRPTSQTDNPPASQSANQPAYEPADQPGHQATHKLANQPANRPANQSSNQRTRHTGDQPTSQPSNQPANQPANQRRTCIENFLFMFLDLYGKFQEIGKDIHKGLVVYTDKTSLKADREDWGVRGPGQTSQTKPTKSHKSFSNSKESLLITTTTHPRTTKDHPGSHRTTL